MAMSSQQYVYKRLGIRTALGTEWFEFSPEKTRDYYYELGAIMARGRFVNDISFSSVLDMSSLNIDLIEDQFVFGSNLCETLDSKIKDDARADMLQIVCGCILNHSEHELLRYQVNKLMDADLVAAGVPFKPESNIYLKSQLLQLHLARCEITRQTRIPRDEFCVKLSKLARRQAGNLVQVQLYVSYMASFESFLSILKDETVLQNDNGGFTLDDGPWKYRILLNGKIGGPWFDLKDQTSFDDMLHKLKGSQGEAAMIHSVEYAIERRHQEDMKEELKHRQDEDVVLDSDGKPFFCSSTYLEYLAMNPQ